MSKPIGSTFSSTLALYIVHTEKPEGEDPKPYYIQTLSNVLGSEEAAEKGVLHSYKDDLNGFSAHLTPEQVAEIKKQPGVLKVEPGRFSMKSIKVIGRG